MKFLAYCFGLIFFSILNLNAQEIGKPDIYNHINESAVKAQLEFLASDWMQGRETGTEGAYMASDYIASMLKLYGVKPAGDIETINPGRREWQRGAAPTKDTTYFQNFSLIEYEPGEEQVLAIVETQKGNLGKTYYNYKSDFIINTSTLGTEINAPVVFVGYGYKNEAEGYNDFDDIDVKGKAILRLEGYPGSGDTSSVAYKKFRPKGRYGEWSLRRDKNKWAEEAGAVAVLSVDLKNDVTLDWAANVPFRYNTPYYEGKERLSSGVMKRMTIPGTENNSLNVVGITRRLAEKLVKGSSVSFEQFEKKTAETLKSSSKEISGKSIYLKTNVKSRIVKSRNVVGIIEGENKNDILVIGAHYDHLGTNNGYIWNGSDDNASGTVGVLTTAKAFAGTGIKPKRTIVFALWTGEEKGLLGSEYFADNFKDIGKVFYYLNYDMISRDDEDDSLGNKVELMYTEDYPKLRELSENYNSELNLGLDVTYDASKRPGGGSDHSSFSAKDIPVMYYFAGFHPEYHQINDTAGKANYRKMTNIIRLGFMEMWELANSEEKLKARQ